VLGTSASPRVLSLNSESVDKEDLFSLDTLDELTSA
jgi:hypothetical protein